MAVQAASILLFSLFGGIWADRWDHRKTMLIVDLVRGAAVLIIPLAATLGQLSLWVIVSVTIVASSLRAFFDPALRACLPRVAQTDELLNSTNALMETTSRFAKILGPGLVGILNQVIPVIHYFTIDAMSFFISAWSITKLKKDLPPESELHTHQGWKGIKDGIVGGFHLSKSRPTIHFIILSDAIVNSAWMFIFPLAIGLLIHERTPDQISNLSLIVGAYGVGNLVANIGLVC